MENKLRKYINKKFHLYPKTKEFVEVREELYSIMLDKYYDCLEMGMPSEDSYQSAIEMMADYKAAIREVETGSSLGALKKNLINTAAISSFYFIMVTLIYLFVSMFMANTFERTWLIAVGGAFVYLVYLSVNAYKYAKLFQLKVLSRCGIGLMYISTIPVLYVFPSMYLDIIKMKNVWSHTWLIILVIILCYIMTDYFVYRKQIHILEKGLHLTAAGLVLTTILYLSISMWFDLWNAAWIVYVVYLAIVSLVFYIGEKTGKIFNENTGG